MASNTRERNEQEQPAEPAPETGKLVMKGVITHEHVLGMVKERNPIIARRFDRR
jgi:hypothetical protein